MRVRQILGQEQLNRPYNQFFAQFILDQGTVMWESLFMNGDWYNNVSIGIVSENMS